MLWTPSALRTVLLGLIVGCSTRPTTKPWANTAQQDSKSKQDDISLQTPHFLIRWQPKLATDAEVKAVEERAELSYARLTELLGAERIARRRLTIRLAGEGSLEQHKISAVDPATGDLVLFHVQGPGGEYEGSLSHELVHALRWRLWTNPKLQTDAFMFLEEGLAELLATEAGFPSGFPTYGYPISVVAGAWWRSDQDLPLAELVRHHFALNFRCMAQVYGLRLSFMTYVHRRFGLAPLIRLAYRETPLRPEDVEHVLGASLASLSRDWRTWADQQNDAIKDASEQMRAYRTQTAIKYFPVCSREDLGHES